MGTRKNLQGWAEVLGAVAIGCTISANALADVGHQTTCADPYFLDAMRTVERRIEGLAETTGEKASVLASKDLWAFVPASEDLGPETVGSYTFGRMIKLYFDEYATQDRRFSREVLDRDFTILDQLCERYRMAATRSADGRADAMALFTEMEGSFGFWINNRLADWGRDGVFASIIALISLAVSAGLLFRSRRLSTSTGHAKGKARLRLVVDNTRRASASKKGHKKTRRAA